MREEVEGEGRENWKEEENEGGRKKLGDGKDKYQRMCEFQAEIKYN